MSTEAELVLQEFDDYGDYLKYLTQNGYISSRNGMPIKCYHCNSKDLIEVDESHDFLGGSYCKTDSKMKCNKCNTTLGEYSYGDWVI